MYLLRISCCLLVTCSTVFAQSGDSATVSPDSIIFNHTLQYSLAGVSLSVKSEPSPRGGAWIAPEQLVQGRIAGVMVTTKDGEPGTVANTFIRGINSPFSNVLIVLDGMPLTTENIAADGSLFGRGYLSARNPFNFINLQDVDSITVIKDGMAALYGARAGAGVVMLSTKSGRSQGLTYSSVYGISTISKYYDVMNRDQFLDAYTAVGGDPAVIDGGADTNWQKEITRVAHAHSHQLAYGDVYKHGNYRASLGYQNQNGIIKETLARKLTARLNLEHRLVNDRLRLGANMLMANLVDDAAPITSNAGYRGDLMLGALTVNPTAAADAEVQPLGDLVNPNGFIKYHYDEAESKRRMMNFTVAYDINDWLQVSARRVFDRSESSRGNAIAGALNMENGIAGNGRSAISELTVRDNFTEWNLNATRKFGKSTLTVRGTYSFQTWWRREREISGFGFSSDEPKKVVGSLRNAAGVLESSIGAHFDQYAYSNADNSNNVFVINSYSPQLQINVPVSPIPAVDVTAVTGSYRTWSDNLQSGIVSGEFDLLGKYVFAAAVRADEYSRFGSDNKMEMFPAVGVQWRLDKEEFFTDYFNRFVIRASYGTSGSQHMGYNAAKRSTSINNSLISADGSLSSAVVTYSGFDNPDLEPEKTSQLSIGTDMVMLEGKLQASLDVYSKQTKNVLVLEADAFSPLYWNNANYTVNNRGIEVGLQDQLVSSTDYEIQLGGNYSFNHNEVKGAAGYMLLGLVYGQGLSGAFTQRTASDRPMNSFYLRDFQGFDENGLSVYREDVQDFVGKSAIPKFSFGINGYARAKRFDLTFLLYGMGGHYIYNNTANVYLTKGTISSGRNTSLEVAESNEAVTNAADVSTRFLEKGDFVRLQSAMIGYNIIQETKAIKRLRIFVGGQNLFVITGYSGQDPEVGKRSGSSYGIDYSGYPRARTFMAGIDVKF